MRAERRLEDRPGDVIRLQIGLVVAVNDDVVAHVSIFLTNVAFIVRKHAHLDIIKLYKLARPHPVGRNVIVVIDTPGRRIAEITLFVDRRVENVDLRPGHADVFFIGERNGQIAGR